MEIKIGIGIENIFFGMYQEDVKRIWGEPDKISEQKKENSIDYYFNDKMVKLNFDGDEDFKLCSITVHNPEMIIFKKKVFLKTKEEIENYLRSNGYFNFEYDDYELFDTLFCEDIWTYFEFEFNRLRSIDFGPLYKNNDEIIWPINMSHGDYSGQI